MRAVLLPVKHLQNAKQRLANILTSEERLALATAMLADTVRALTGVSRAGKIFLATSYEPAMRAAAEHGWDLLQEKEQISESHSVDAASRICAERGVSHLLRLPLDLPLVQSADIDELLAIDCSAPAVVIVPSRDGTGTNAILRAHPCLFPSHFGAGSFARHLAEGAQAGAQIVLRRNPRLEMDVDDESDLRALLQHDLTGTSTGAFLSESGIAARFHSEIFKIPGRGAAPLRPFSPKPQSLAGFQTLKHNLHRE
jgi:2-phospho-L-lactate guanylyltransferase